MDNTLYSQGGILFKLHHPDLPRNLSNAVHTALLLYCGLSLWKAVALLRDDSDLPKLEFLLGCIQKYLYDLFLCVFIPKTQFQIIPQLHFHISISLFIGCINNVLVPYQYPIST